MTGLNQRQSDAVIEVFAKYEGFIRTAEASDCDKTGDCLHCRAQRVLKECAEVIRGSKAA